MAVKDVAQHPLDLASTLAGGAPAAATDATHAATAGTPADVAAAGALGASFGLQYGHEINTSDAEISALAKVIAKHNKIFSVHLRSQEGAQVDTENLVMFGDNFC